MPAFEITVSDPIKQGDGVAVSCCHVLPFVSLYACWHSSSNEMPADQSQGHLRSRQQQHGVAKARHLAADAD